MKTVEPFKSARIVSFWNLQLSGTCACLSSKLQSNQNLALMPLQFSRQAISEAHSCIFHPMLRFVETQPLSLHSRPFLWVALGAGVVVGGGSHGRGTRRVTRDRRVFITGV